MSDDSASETGHFEAERSRLFGLAYRILGSAVDAEDVVQDAWLRWTREPRADVASPAAWLTTAVSRLAIDRLRSRQARRDEYIGPWLPEPIATDGAPASDLSRADDLTMAFLLLLEHLSPAERAVFVLREAFQMPYREVAAIVEQTEENCRQLLRRAKQHLADHPPPRATRPADATIIERFLGAIQQHDEAGLASLLRKDIALHSDGGGIVTAATRPLHGPTRVVAFLLGLAAKAARDGTDVRVEPRILNQRPGYLLHLAGQLDSAWHFEIAPDADQIAAIHIVRNPNKLRHLRPAPPSGA